MGHFGMRKNKKSFGKEKSLWEQGLNLVFPEKLYCISCGRILEGEERKKDDSLCSECRRKLLWDAPGRCCRCGRFLNPARESLLCVDCRGREWSLEEGVVCCEYDGDGKRLVLALKYGEKGYLAKPMGYLMEQAVKKLPKYDVIIPVPMYRKKEKIRGYNQAELLARWIGNYSGKSCLKDGLVRVCDTTPMSGLSLEERKRMIKGVIRVKYPEKILGKTVLLVDDIFTTGSTGEECGRVLKEAGAKRVFFSAFAATPPQSGYNGKK